MKKICFAALGIFLASPVLVGCSEAKADELSLNVLLNSSIIEEVIGHEEYTIVSYPSSLQTAGKLQWRIGNECIYSTVKDNNTNYYLLQNGVKRIPKTDHYLAVYLCEDTVQNEIEYVTAQYNPTNYYIGYDVSREVEIGSEITTSASVSAEAAGSSVEATISDSLSVSGTFGKGESVTFNFDVSDDAPSGFYGGQLVSTSYTYAVALYYYHPYFVSLFRTEMRYSVYYTIIDYNNVDLKMRVTGSESR